MHHRRAHNQLGFNLIEAALVLGIVGLVIGGIFAAWGNVESQQRVRRASDMTTTIVQQIRSTYASRTTFDATDTASGATFTAALIAANLIPVEYLSGTNLLNPWGGTTLITPNTTGMNISYSTVKKADCLKLANNMLSNGKTNGLTSIGGQAVDNTTVFSSISGSICGTDPSTLNLFFLLKTN